MKEQKGKTEDGQEVDRRRFIEFLAVLGATSLVAQGCSPPPPDQVLAGGPADSLAASGPSPDATKGITVEAIKAAEEIIGIELTEPERRRILDGLRENLAGFIELREKDLGAADFPAVAFNPIPPGYPIPSEKKPIHWGRIATPTPAKVEDCCFHSILQLADLLRSRRATSVDLTKICLARLKKYDPDLQFVVNLTEELALEQAERADAEIANGDYRGPLHGIPYGIKDLFSVKGYPTTWGAEPFRDRVIETDASVVRKLEKAGAVLVAKLATGRLASGEEWYGGTTRNPWRPSRPSGGSSGGPASAIAAGCVGFSFRRPPDPTPGLSCGSSRGKASS